MNGMGSAEARSRVSCTVAPPAPAGLDAAAERCVHLEAQLAAGEARFRDFLEFTSDWLWETDENLRFTFFSARLAELTGIAPEHLLGKTRQEIMADTTSPDARRHLADLAARRPFQGFIYAIEAPQGRRVVKISGKPVFDGAGRFGGYRGTGSDITVVIEADRRVEQIHRRFVDAIEAVPAGLMLTDADDRIVIWNSITATFFPRVAHLLRPGTRFEDLQRAHAESGIVAEAQGRVEEWVQERMRAHRNPGGVLTRQWSDGRWIQIIERKTSGGGVIGIRMDVTELKGREIELQRTRSHLREAIETMPASFILYDADNRVALCNSRAKQFFPEIADLLMPGASAEELARERYRRNRPQASPAEIAALVDARMEQFGKAVGVISELHPDGRSTQAFERRMPDGGVVCIRVDVTELKEKEASLALQAEELRRSNAELEQFAYIASHDLQEPLRMVASYCQLLQRRYTGKLDESADEFIAFAVEGATRMQHMINDLLTFSRAGRKREPFEPVACGEVVATALRNLQIAIEESGATVEVGPLPTVLGDRSQLVQLFQNLIGNAIKFRGEARVQVQVDAEATDDGWRFTVTDTGIGIEPAYLEKIFLIFQRLHGRTKYPGTGIGLAICKRVVERHGGRIWVESEPGRGSRFIFTLSAADAPGGSANRAGP